MLGKPNGVATNGGCHCLDGLDFERKRRAQSALYAYRKLVEEAASALYADRANGDRERWLAKKKEVLG